MSAIHTALHSIISDRMVAASEQVLNPFKDLDTPSFSLAVSKGLGPSAIYIWGGRVHCC